MKVTITPVAASCALLLCLSTPTILGQRQSPVTQPVDAPTTRPATLPATLPARGEPGLVVSRELLMEGEAVLRFREVGYHRCQAITALCPDRCGASGDYARFDVLAYTRYHKPGTFGDAMAKINAT